ncbi:unnamed protein product [Arctia plantaginis]|uniref:Alpha-1,4-N-acetylglucosaminyltransferase n=1 Tax=Arctia plantaginis TaxID=874455 RepID=A0A8S1BP37_ARCPL|nr:unnamed protein product [Arctia plantaginis]
MYVFIYIILQHQRPVSQTQEVVMASNIMFGNSEESQDYRCHYLRKNSSLPEVTAFTTFPVNSIFFIDSSCSGLTLRKACSVESAARANPERQIVVLSTSPMNPENAIIKKLLSLNNTSVLRIHLENYAEETPLDGKFRKKPLSFEDLNIDLADILKFLTLYKYSGIYLSMDVIVARKFEGLLSNWVVNESPATMSSDMFCFSGNFNGRAMAHVALK